MFHANIEYHVRLTGSGTIHPGAGCGGHGIDRLVGRSDGEPYVPGSHIRGIARHNALRVARRLFPSDDAADARVKAAFESGFGAGLTIFRDLRPTDHSDKAITRRHRVTIDRRSGTQVDKRLFDLEVWHVRELRGSVEFHTSAEEDASRALALLLAGLRMVDALGGSRSAGLGQCEVMLDRVEADGRELTPDEALAPLFEEVSQ